LPSSSTTTSSTSSSSSSSSSTSKRGTVRHRDVLNSSSDWIRSLLALYQPNAGAASTQ
jgi:hypothetical protein